MGQAKRRGTFEERKEKAIQRDDVLNETYFKERNEAVRRIAIIGAPHRTSISLALMLAALYPPHKI